MTTLTFTVEGAPRGAVRQSRKDAWKPSLAVQRYRAWRDVVRAAFVSAKNLSKPRIPASVPGEVHMIAYLPIPPSWSKKKQLEMVGRPHLSTPDADNIYKGATDPIFEQDGGIHFESCRKRYDDGRGPHLEITMIWEDL